VKGDPEPLTERVRITNPLTTASPHLRRSVQQEIDESTAVGEVYMRSLIRSQLRLALVVLFTLMLSLGILPIVFITFDSVTTYRVAGVPLPWWILGLLVYPFLIVLGWLYTRQADRAESDFAELVERP
jgi:O-antigen/teichoic acid export membrane protein